MFQARFVDIIGVRYQSALKLILFIQLQKSVANCVLLFQTTKFHDFVRQLKTRIKV